ncbi:diacylglycerol/lipid kinase family protein [Lihuaxuella thermophila]|uniref:Lipid kinase, YegS/Rv2252/BmrU family n=1 Tax=Lihuaxuella thermophila TaxID=1173111 RepID=A0A1H8EUC5_9BACL|nr:diacylglycerol kinase family protein [Lihuaxuella thermophila]SEN23093.1 lipid kinase, YegS/Rv2252/BmrU family [Lihuaxuella thermophila]
MRVFIVNSVSGNGRGRKIWLQVQRLLEERNIPYQVEFTKGPGHAAEIAESAARSNVQAVVAIGGDGTVNEVGNGLAGTEIPMGYIPAGSGNDFALAQNIPSDPEQALQRVLDHQVRRVDTAEIGERMMIGFAGVGFDAKVADTVNHSPFKRWAGRSIYFFGAVQVLTRFRPASVSLLIDGKRCEYQGLWLIAVTNNPYYGGGMKICPDAKNDDGWLDICCVHNLKHAQFLKMFPSVYKGKHVNHPSVTLLRGKEITIDSEAPLVVHADGEVIGRTPLSIRVRPQSLCVL